MISNMKLQRIKKELTQVDVWMKTGICQSRISLIEGGFIAAKLDEKEKISKVLHCETEDIFPEKEGVKDER